MKEISVKKGQILQRKGDLNTKVYVVQSGLLRSYSVDDKGKEHVFMFAPENWIMADITPADIPAELFIDVIEDTIILVKEKVIDADIQAESIFRRLKVLQTRVIMLMSSSAIERYQHFVATYPEIIQRVPQRMVASYLGITPEALSKVKGESLRTK